LKKTYLRKTQREVFDISRKTLADLASSEPGRTIGRNVFLSSLDIKELKG